MVMLTCFTVQYDGIHMNELLKDGQCYRLSGVDSRHALGRPTTSIPTSALPAECRVQEFSER